jgi:hypothetical protein
MTSKCHHITADDIRHIIRLEAAKAGGIPEWCEKNKVGTSYIYEMLRGQREPSSMIMNKVGYRRVILGEPMKNTKE